MLYDFFRDQGGIIAGVIALLAGVVAYLGAMRAAKMQVSAVEQQTNVVRQQNAHLKSETPRRLAHDGIIAVRLLEGVLRRIADDIARLSKLLDQPAYCGPNAVAPADWRKLISKPPLSTVWNNLGICEPEVVYHYLLLDAKIDEFENTAIGVDNMKNRLADLVNIVKLLQNRLEGVAQRYSGVLADFSQEGI